MFEESTTVRPTLDSMLAIVAVAVLWSSIVAAFCRYVSLPWFGELNSAFMVVLVLVAWRSKVALRLFERGGTIFYASGFGAPRAVVAAGDGSRVVRVSDPKMPGVLDLWLDAAGRVRLRTSEVRWNANDLRALWLRVGIAPPHEPEIVDLSQADKRYPTAGSGLRSTLFGETPVKRDPDLRTVRPVPAQFSRLAILDDGRTLRLRDPLGRVRKVLAPGEGGRVVRVTARASRGSVRKQLWIDPAGRCRMQLDEVAWNTDELTILRERLGLPLEERTESMTRGEINREFPGARLTTELEAWVAAASTVGGAFVVVMIYAFLTR